MFNLWSDSYSGEVGGQYASSSRFKPYQLKSSYDPCPHGWRIPSHNGYQVTLSAFSVWGRDSGHNDDSDYKNIYPNTTNPKLIGVKAYPGLGIDFTDVTNRSISIYPLTGNYDKNDNPNNKPIFQDVFSESNIWSTTSYNSSARSFKLFTAYDRIDNDPIYGMHKLLFSSNAATDFTQQAQAVRCIVDPNINHLPDFSAEYISTDTQKRNYKTGLDNPNSYIIENNITQLDIPINKAFAIYNQYLTDREWPSGTLGAKVVWTTNTNLVKKVSLVNANISDPNSGIVKVEFGDNTPKGNAVISLTVNDEIIWSWHLWAPNTNPTLNPITYTNEESIPSLNLVNTTKSGVHPLTTTFMDRNLGALDAFPSVINPSNPTSSELDLIENSGGLHYQWGRKDPIPTFSKVGGTSYVIYLESEKDLSGNSLYNSIITENDYLNNYTKSYNIYGSSPSTPRYKKIQKSITYSVNNPLHYLYHLEIGSPNVYQDVKDWIADERSLADNRWGHADKKSPFDPCPAGWRVPDVSFVFYDSNTFELGSYIYSGAIGTSPWYRNKIRSGSSPEQNRHLIQKNKYGINSTYYEGNWIPNYGWTFNAPEYNIGNYPATGVRGIAGGNNISGKNTLSDVWTSALSDLGQGFGLTLSLGVNTANTEGTLKFGGGRYPQAGANIRCAIDEPRYLGASLSNKNISGEGLVYTEESITLDKANTLEEILVYPNPVKDILHINTDNNIRYSIHNLSGDIILRGVIRNSKINISKLPSGIYILKLVNINSKVEVIKKIIKE